jgi:DNA polymerase-3 subunit epsilon
MILFFDTETTGLPDYRMPPEHECQPSIVQIAMSLTDDTGTERASASMVVQVIGREIPTAASKVHGITTQMAAEFGVYPTAALYVWDRFAQMADTVVAHNLKFDLAVIEAAWTKHNPAFRTTVPDFHGRHDRLKQFCTMEAASPIVNLPPTDRMIAAGFNKPKSPKLEECVKHFFGEEHSGAHDALADLRACARLYFHLQSSRAAA